ncbi:Hypothetical_protein [Hexamita inflata]|uniref:Hypothetical_protein n=1 Tax=Hexamita inflata TaxID=28002 RepID=A0AA86QUB4_9EUKA|nr:Hypothetical protein HINF_LOCUS53839 [Hexamita inflata]
MFKQTLASKNCLSQFRALFNFWESAFSCSYSIQLENLLTIGLEYFVLILLSQEVLHTVFFYIAQSQITTVLVMAAQGQARNSTLQSLITSYLSLQEKLYRFLLTTFTGWVLFQVIGTAGDAG